MRSLVRFVLILLTVAFNAWAQVDLPEGPGKYEVESLCGQCHGLDQTTSLTMTPAGWRRTIESMVGYGADFTDEEKSVMLRYLTEHFGREATPVRDSASIFGTVSGPMGLLPNVEVTLLLQGRVLQVVRSDAQGAFQFADLDAGDYQIQAVLNPYPPAVQEVALSTDGPDRITVNILLAPLAQSLTVTAGRIAIPVSTTTSNVKILSDEALHSMPYVALDDHLRTLPGFSLFRRSSSLVAHPTTQGVSLRGIGPSGVSRSLVLLDGVPMNDAFGGWVYWDRVPLAGVQQVEVVNGGQSSAYGNFGLGGVVQLLRRPPTPSTLELQLQGGSKQSRDVEFVASHRFGSWGVAASGSYFDFDGYPVVAEAQRGSVDIPATSSHEATRFEIDLSPKDSSFSWSLLGGHLNEDRGNGTPLTSNSTRSFDFSTELRWSPSATGHWEFRSFFRRTIFNSNYAAVASDRNSERLTVQQTVPSVDGGAALQWNFTRGAISAAAGADLWMVSGASADSVIVAGPSILLIREGGGKQATVGLFAEANLQVSPKANLVGGIRVDRWENYDGRQGSYAPGERAQLPSVPDTTRAVLSPSAGITFDATTRLNLFGSVFRSFRAPTLNELYRGFRVGNITTNPNRSLVPEHTVGGEFGARYAVREGFRIELSGFINRLENPVSNVTVQDNGSQIVRQRQNLGNARIFGLQGTATWQPLEETKFEAVYLWDRASVTDFEADPSLVGKRLPQVPEHRTTLTAEFSLPGILRASVVGRFVGGQFDDDLNSVTLDQFFQLDANLWRDLGESARVFLSMENITDSKIIVGRSPVDVLGTPFLVRGGITLRWNGNR